MELNSVQREINKGSSRERTPANNRQIILNEQGFFVEAATKVVESVGTSTLC